MNATNAVVENKLEPVAPQAPVQQLKVTGQYLFDNFVKPDESDKTRLIKIQELVADGVDALQLKGAADKMVELARQADLDAGTPEKESVVINGKEAERRTRGPKEASAMNRRTEIQQVWGALKFADVRIGDAGYLTAVKIAKKALDERRIDWKGDALKTDADRQQARLKRQQKEETDAKINAMKNLPRLPDESELDHYQRVLKASEASIADARKSAERKIVDDVVESIYKRHGQAIALAVAEAIALREGVEITFQPPVQSTPAEPTEQEALEAMAQVPEEQAAH
jgi:hypothetical protein